MHWEMLARLTLVGMLLVGVVLFRVS